MELGIEKYAMLIIKIGQINNEMNANTKSRKNQNAPRKNTNTLEYRKKTPLKKSGT